MELEIFEFCVITFDSIKIETHLAPQNDRLNLSFVKDEIQVAKKWPEMVQRAIYLVRFISDQSLLIPINTKPADWKYTKVLDI